MVLACGFSRFDVPRSGRVTVGGGRPRQLKGSAEEASENVCGTTDPEQAWQIARACLQRLQEIALPSRQRLHPVNTTSLRLDKFVHKAPSQQAGSRALGSQAGLRG